MDAISLLTTDHRTVDSLFGRWPQGSAEERREVAAALVKELSIHATIEETHFYPELRKDLPDGSELADHSLEEHAEVKRLLAELDDHVKEPGTLEVDELVTQLQTAVQHHVKEEETEIFPKLREAISAERLEEIGAKMEEQKKTAPTRPHPHAPDEPPGNVIAGAPAAAMDKLRDKASGR